MRFPPNMILILFGSGFCGLYSTAIQANVIFLSAVMLLIVLWSRKNAMLVSGVLVALWPYSMFYSFMVIAFVHDSFVKELLTNFSIAGDGFSFFWVDYRVCIMFNQWYVVNS